MNPRAAKAAPANTEQTKARQKTYAMGMEHPHQINPIAAVHLHIFGASGSGTTTLGAALARQLGWLHLESDDFYWRQTAQPFSEVVAPDERVQAMQQRLQGVHDWIISGGSLMTWGRALQQEFTHVVFLRLDNAIRMQRLHQRERDRFGEALDKDPERRRISTNFLDWAAGYEAGDDTQRSLRRHQRWIAELACPVLQLDTLEPLDGLLQSVRKFIQK